MVKVHEKDLNGNEKNAWIYIARNMFYYLSFFLFNILVAMLYIYIYIYIYI